MALSAPALTAKERRGHDVAVTKKDGTVMEGELLAVRGSGLILMLEAGTAGVEVDLKEVSDVTIVKKSQLGRGLAWGGLIGAGAGAAVGAAVWKPDQPGTWSLMRISRGQLAVYGALALGAIGLVVGGLVGAGAGVNEKIEIDAADPISIGRVVGRLQPLARDRS
jgi:hypothetical protein